MGTGTCPVGTGQWKSSWNEDRRLSSGNECLSGSVILWDCVLMDKLLYFFFTLRFYASNMCPPVSLPI